MKTSYTEQQSNETILHTLPSDLVTKLQECFGDKITEDDLRNESLEGYEDIFDVFETSLPHDLITHNIAMLLAKKSNLYEAIQHFTKIAELRKSTWEIDSNEQYLNEAKETITNLSNARFHTNLFLGRGNAGHVFIAPNTEDYCIKYLHSPSKQATSLEEEFVLLSDVNTVAKNFSVLNIPQAHCMAKNLNGTKNFFTMERVRGLTLEQLVEFPQKRADMLPQHSTEALIALLEDMHTRSHIIQDLEKLHQHGIIHGDIHSRNIMIDEQGKIWLIDFGNAVVPVNVSVHATYDSIENVKDIDMKTFINSLDKAVSLLREQTLTK